jgi:hypothetical protein
MKRVYIHKEKRKLESGEVLEFQVIKTVFLPNDKAYFVVQDTFGDRHLVPTWFYEGYAIILGKSYPFHVDKINCKGQVFLEPLHPVYEVGKSYEFRYIKTIEELNKKGERVCYYLLEGKNGYQAQTMGCESVPKHNVWKKYKVHKIKKAKVFVS